MTKEEREELRRRYRGDKLYKAWSHPLMELERELHQPAPEEIWHLTERLHVRLRDLGDDAPYEIDYVFRDLYEPLVGGDVTRGDAMFTAVVISTVLLSQLCASRPQVGTNPNQASCRALARILTKDEFLPVCGTLIDMLKGERIDMNGNPVIVPVTNYLDEAETGRLVSGSTLREVDMMVDGICDRTKALSVMMSCSFESYRSLWHQILVMPDMLTRARVVSPRGNAWGFNLKLVANVLGIMMTCRRMENNSTRACNLIGMGNARNYISYNADFGTSNTALGNDEHKRVVEIVKAMEKAR